MRTEKSCDVVVVGSGGAGIRAAIAAAEAGCSVTLLSKGKVDRSGATPMAGAGICGDVDADGRSLFELGFEKADKSIDQDVWFRDIVISGGYLNDQVLLRRHIEEAPRVVKELLDLGVEVMGMESSTALAIQGIHILEGLLKRARALDVTICENVLVADVLRGGGGEVAGVVGVVPEEGEIVCWPSKSVVIATGGMHGIYGNNTGSSCLTGDGIAMAHRFGAELVNMEMTEFCCDTVLLPQKWKGSIMPYIMTAFGVAERVNVRGEPFVQNYYSGKTLNLAMNSEWNKMLVSMAEHSEIAAGRGRDGGIPITMNREKYEAACHEFPIMKHNRQIDDMWTSQFIVVPAGHYFVGGIRVDRDFQSTVPGLFACGESAAGIFGANRVASALTEMLTTGKIAGGAAAAFAGNAADAFPQDAEEVAAALAAPFSKPKGEDVFRIEEEMKKTMDKNVGVVKNERSLQEARRDLDGLSRSFNATGLLDSGRVYDIPWIIWLNLRNMLPLARMIVDCSLHRKESRGVFVRDDCFYYDNVSWLTNTVVRADGSIDSVAANLAELRPDFGKLGYFEAINRCVEKVGQS